MRGAHRQPASNPLRRPAWGFGLGLAFYAMLVALSAAGVYVLEPRSDRAASAGAPASQPMTAPAAPADRAPHRSCAAASDASGPRWRRGQGRAPA